MEEEQLVLIKSNSSSKKEDKLDADHEHVPGNEQQNASNITLPTSPSCDHMMDDELVDSCVAADDQLSHASKALVLLNKIVLAKLKQEKVLSLIKAWEDNVKAKSHNRLGKKLAEISAREKAKKAQAEAHLQKLEEKYEKKKASFVEDVMNDIAAVRRKAEEDRAVVEAEHGAQTLKAEEVAAKYRASGKLPRKYALCFGI